MSDATPWRRVPDSIRFYQARHKDHFSYFDADYERLVLDEHGVYQHEVRQGKPCYAHECHGDSDVALACKVLGPLLRALDLYEKEHGGPPEVVSQGPSRGALDSSVVVVNVLRSAGVDFAEAKRVLDRILRMKAAYEEMYEEHEKKHGGPPQ